MAKRKSYKYNTDPERQGELARRRLARNNYVKRHRERVRETQKFAQLKMLYGITRDEYYELMEDHLNKCAICDSTEKLVIDHCHSTNKIRGILCTKCNATIGFARENIEILKNTIAYLHYHSVRLYGK